MAERTNKISELLSDDHFKFTLFFNCFFFVFYFFWRIFMALNLVLVNRLNFFTGVFKYHEEGRPYYTLFRVFIPIYLFLGFLVLGAWLYKKSEIKIILRRFLELLYFKMSTRRYLVFLLVSFVILSCVPGFTLLVRHLDTQYGVLDADSYASLVAIMYRGDFNAGYVPEGGLQFGKYYMVTMPTLILVSLLGIGNLVASYNIAVTLLVFLTIVNVGFVFVNLFFTKKECLIDEIFRLLFIGAIIILALRLVIFRDYFNFDALLLVYCNGFYGAIGGMYLLSSAFMVITYLTREQKIDFTQRNLLFLLMVLVGSMLVQAYFNLTLFFLPSSGVLIAIFLSRKDSFFNAFKKAGLFLAYLILNFGSYFAVDIFPLYSMNPVKKFNFLIIALFFSFWLFFLINRFGKNILLRLFLKCRSIPILGAIFIPFLLSPMVSGTFAGDLKRIEFLGHPLVLGTSRVIFLSLILRAMVIGYLIFGLLRIFFVGKPKSVFYGLIVVVFGVSLLIARNYHFRESQSLGYSNYPSFYPKDRQILDLGDKYNFDENGIKVTYNQYLVEVIKYFEKNKIHDMWYWLVTKTPPSGTNENGLLQRILLTSDHNLEGMVVRDVDSFIGDISILEEESRHRVEKFKNRYLIIDNNFSLYGLELIENSSLFEKVYQNKLYGVYKLE